MDPFQHKTHSVIRMVSVEEYRGDGKRGGLKQELGGGEGSELCLSDLEGWNNCRGRGIFSSWMTECESALGTILTGKLVLLGLCQQHIHEHPYRLAAHLSPL